MAETFLIHPADADRWNWAYIESDSGAVLREGNCSADELAAMAGSPRTLLLLPGTDVILETADLPAARESEMPAAAAYLLEDRFAERIEDLHFSPGERDSAGRVAVAIVRKELLRDWTETLRQCGIRPQWAASEVLALPWEAGTWSLAVCPQILLLRTGISSGFALDRALETEFTAMLASMPGPAVSIRVWNVDTEFGGEVLAKLREAGRTLLEQPTPRTRAALFAQGLARLRPSPNLLQGEFADQPGGGRWWWPAAAVLLLAFVTHVLWSLWDLNRIDSQRMQLQSAGEALFRQTFPEVKRIVDVKAQAEQQLQELRHSRRGGSDFMRLFVPAAAEIHSVPDAELIGVAFDSQFLELRLRADEIRTVDALAQRLAGNNIVAEIVSSTTRDGKVEARLRLSRAGS